MDAMLRITAATLVVGLIGGSVRSFADDQSMPGIGNAASTQTAMASPFVQSALARDRSAVEAIHDPRLKAQTLDALFNPATCIRHRANLTEAGRQAILTGLLQAGLVNPADAAALDGGLEAGVFPAVLADGTACPHLPQAFGVAPGSNFHGHQGYPGGLAIHEGFNLVSSAAFALNYELTYGLPGPDGLPRMANVGTIAATGVFNTVRNLDLDIASDEVLAAPLWHDWAKTIVFQWNADGSEFTELSFGGAGTNDNYGSAGDSRTGGHHILSLAEAMVRGLPAFFIITQASAHSAPTLGNEYKVVNWLRAAAIIARVDPVAAGYLVTDQAGHLRLPSMVPGGGLNLLASGQTNIRIEYEIHNLSDADFVFSIPAVTGAEAILQSLAPEYGYDPTDVTRYNTRYHNPALSNLSGERLLTLYITQGLDAVRNALDILRRYGKI